MRRYFINGGAITAKYIRPPRNIREIWLKQTIQPETASASLARIWASPIGGAQPPEAHTRLARAVLAQAIFDAMPARRAPQSPPRRIPYDRARLSPARIRLEHEALLFLSDPDDAWMAYWCGMAGIKAQPVRARFQKRLRIFQDYYRQSPAPETP